MEHRRIVALCMVVALAVALELALELGLAQGSRYELGMVGLRKHHQLLREQQHLREQHRIGLLLIEQLRIERLLRQR